MAFTLCSHIFSLLLVKHLLSTSALHIGANIIPLPSDVWSVFDVWSKIMHKTNDAYINVNSLLNENLYVTQTTHLPLFTFWVQFPLQRHALVHLKPFLMHPQCPALHNPPLHPHLDFLHGLMAWVICWCASWIEHFGALSLLLYVPASIASRICFNGAVMFASSLVPYLKAYDVSARCHCVHRCRRLSLLLSSTCPLVLCHSPLSLRSHRVNAPLLVVMPLKSRRTDCTKMKTPVWSQAKWMSSDGEKQIVKEKPEHKNLG